MSAVVKVAALLAVVLSLVLGYYVGSGYTMEVRYFYCSGTSTSRNCNFTSTIEYLVMLVFGLAY